RGSVFLIAGRAALDCEERFAASRDGWEAVKACSLWRMAERPERGLAVTEDLAETSEINVKVHSAVFATRGGAVRDLRSLNEAEACGQKAINLSHQTFHPYMLLGALCYLKGNPQKGDEYFATAMKLGAQPKSKDLEIRRALLDAGDAEKRIVVE